MRPPLFQFDLFVLDELLPVPEEEGDAPNTRQRDNRIDHATNGSALAAESPCHYVELKQADAAPVDGADDHKDQCQSVQHVFHSFFMDAVRDIRTGIVWTICSGLYSLAVIVRLNDLPFEKM